MSRKPCRFRSLAHERKLDNVQYQANIDTLHSFHQRIQHTENGVKFNEGLDTLDYELLSSEFDTVGNFEKIKVEI